MLRGSVVVQHTTVGSTVTSSSCGCWKAVAEAAAVVVFECLYDGDVLCEV